MNSVPLTAPIAAGGLPARSEANAPASVRNGDAAVKQAYAAAKGFEGMLLQQLSQSLTQSSGLSGEGEGGAGGESPGGEGSGAGGEAGMGMLASLLPQTLTESVMREGGLGLATQLVGALDPTATTGVTKGALGPSTTAGDKKGALGPSTTAGDTKGALAPTGGASA
jgi:hypothetical protein